MSDMSIRIMAAAYYLPPKWKPIDEVFRDEQVPDEPFGGSIDFRGQIGIEAVHVAGGETAANLPLEPLGVRFSRRGSTRQRSIW
jgi:hypothetical protein